MEGAVEPVESCAHVILLATAVIVAALAEAGSAKVEAQDGQALGLEGLHCVVDDLVVHGSAAERMRMTEQHGVFRIRRAGVEQRFEMTGWAGEVVDGADGLGWRGHRGLP